MSTRPHPESARIIREARQAAGLTQKELAEKLDVTIGTIGYYERGVGQPKTEPSRPYSATIACKTRCLRASIVIAPASFLAFVSLALHLHEC